MQYKEGQMSFREAWANHRDTALKVLLGQVKEDVRIRLNDPEIDGHSLRAFNLLAHADDPQVGLYLKAQVVGDMTLEMLSKIPKLGEGYSKTIYNWYAKNATQTDSHGQTEKISESNYVIKCVAKPFLFKALDGQKFLILHGYFVPVLDVVGVHVVEIGGISHFRFQYITTCDMFDGENAGKTRGQCSTLYIKQSDIGDEDMRMLRDTVASHL
jgi:hypothetical protein